MTKPVDVIQSLFAAFGQGDLPAMLALVADDVDWAGDKFDADIPTHVNRRGKAEVPKFFEAVATEQDFARFEPLHFATAMRLQRWCARNSPSAAPAGRW